MLHYNPWYVSTSTMLIFRRSNCIITASGIITLCKRLYSTSVESGLTGGQKYWLVVKLVGGVHAPYQLDNKEKKEEEEEKKKMSKRKEKQEEEEKEKKEEAKKKKNFSVNPFKGVPT